MRRNGGSARRGYSSWEVGFVLNRVEDVLDEDCRVLFEEIGDFCQAELSHRFNVRIVAKEGKNIIGKNICIRIRSREGLESV